MDFPTNNNNTDMLHRPQNKEITFPFFPFLQFTRNNFFSHIESDKSRVNPIDLKLLKKTEKNFDNKLEILVVRKVLICIIKRFRLSLENHRKYESLIVFYNVESWP